MDANSIKFKDLSKNNSVLKEAEEFLKEIKTSDKDDKKLVDLPRKINDYETIKGKNVSDEGSKTIKLLRYEKEDFNNYALIDSFVEKEKLKKNLNIIECISNNNNEKINNYKQDFNLIENINSLKGKKNELEEENLRLSKLVETLRIQLDKEKEISLKENEEYHKFLKEFNLSLKDLQDKNQSLFEENKELKMNLTLKQKEIDFLQNQSINFDSIIRQLKEEYDNRYRFHKEEIEKFKKEKEKLSEIIIEIENRFKIEKSALLKDYNDRLYQFKEKEKLRLTEIESALDNLESENKSLRENFDNFLKKQKKNSSSESINRKAYYLSEPGIEYKKGLNSDKCDTLMSVKNEIELLEERINKNNSILRNFEFSTNRGNEESKSMIYNIMRQLEEDTENLLQLKKKANDLNKIR